ncbi:MAG: hypothetical protein JWM42_1785, partial [Burkholderia sp.]|nr:hypothetical protein [Burkholderia sp.]
MDSEEDLIELFQDECGSGSTHATAPRRNKLGNLAAVAGCGARREKEP